MAFTAKRLVFVVFVSWSLVSADIDSENARQNPRRLVLEDNQVGCVNPKICWNGNAFIWPLWQNHKAIHWRCSEPGLIAMAFDDAPDALSTPLILDELNRLGINATFFVSARRIDETTKEFLIRADAEGHTIGSNTFDDYGGFLGVPADQRVDFLNKQVYKNELEVEKYIPQMKRYIRPPHFVIDKIMSDELAAHGYKIIMRNLETYDWRHYWTNEQRMEAFDKGINASAEAAATNSYITAQIGTPVDSVALIRRIYAKYKDYYKFVDMETCLGERWDASSSAAIPWTHSPSAAPSNVPSAMPSHSMAPSVSPSIVPSSSTSEPTVEPTTEGDGDTLFLQGRSNSSLKGLPMGSLFLLPSFAALLALLMM